ncbi:hypothetical protein ACF09H_22225 [Streptomyces sp. NPDC014983]|uniref:hypothetical protein n=1 Tax=Streptomyces sp. NPDC014983 TaxID=3364933 RepID=UPI0036FBC3F2
MQVNQDDFLPLPSLSDPHQLVTYDPAWTYPSACAGGGGMALLRVWRTADGGHLAIVTENGIAVSITNAAEEISEALTRRYPGPLVILEHYPAGDGAPHDRLDQVLAVPGRTPRWRPIWPTSPVNPDYTTNRAWMDAYGTTLLSATTR